MHYLKGGGTWEVDSTTGGVQACRGDVGKDYMRVLLETLCNGRPDAAPEVGGVVAVGTGAVAGVGTATKTNVTTKEGEHDSRERKVHHAASLFSRAGALAQSALGFPSSNN